MSSLFEKDDFDTDVQKLTLQKGVTSRVFILNPTDHEAGYSHYFSKDGNKGVYLKCLDPKGIAGPCCEKLGPPKLYRILFVLHYYTVDAAGKMIDKERALAGNLGEIEMWKCNKKNYNTLRDKKSEGIDIREVDLLLKPDPSKDINFKELESITAAPGKAVLKQSEKFYNKYIAEYQKLKEQSKFQFGRIVTAENLDVFLGLATAAAGQGLTFGGSTPGTPAAGVNEGAIFNADELQSILKEE